MKKTLITLAALAMGAFASANTVSDDLKDDLASGLTDMTLSVASPSERVKAPDTSDSYTWIAVMDWTDVNNTLGNWQNKSRIYATDNWNTDAALGVVIFHNDSGELAIQFAEHTTDVFYSANDGTLSHTGTAPATNIFSITNDGTVLLKKGVSTSSGDKVVLSFSYDDTNKVYTFGVLTSDNNLSTISFTKDATWDKSPYNGADLTNKAADAVEHFMWFDSALTANEIAAVATYAIPEPTTATLSLLALAGLAARRRRK